VSAQHQGALVGLGAFAVLLVLDRHASATQQAVGALLGCVVVIALEWARRTPPERPRVEAPRNRRREVRP